MNRSSIYRVLAGVWCLAAVAGHVELGFLGTDLSGKVKFALYLNEF